MKCSPFLALAVALCLAASRVNAQTEAPPERPMLPEIQALWTPYQAALKAVEYDRDQKLKNLDYIYLLNLDKQQKERAAAGDLDGALAAKAEMDRLGARQETTAEQIKAMNPPLQKFRVAYDAAMKSYEAEALKSNATLLRKLLADLEELQRRITTTGDLDTALKVKAEKERIAAEAAQGRPAPVTEQSKPPVPTPGAAPTERNLLVNPNFENGTDGWMPFKNTGEFAIDPQEQHNGKPSCRIANAGGMRMTVLQKISVKPGTRYLLSAFIKTKSVIPVQTGQKEGAELVVDDRLGGSRRSTPISQTNDWTRVTCTVVTNASENQISVGFALGHWYARGGGYHAPVTGTAWFSELSLTELGENGKK